MGHHQEMGVSAQLIIELRLLYGSLVSCSGVVMWRQSRVSFSQLCPSNVS